MEHGDEYTELFLLSQGYQKVCYICGKGWCALLPMMTTWGLYVGLTIESRGGRYCYTYKADAIAALTEWFMKSERGEKVEGDPPDEDWIKYKGAVEYSNPHND